MEKIDPVLLHIRQSALITPELRNATVLVAGVGMLGSWAALSLARCAGSVEIWDFDEVEDVNAGTQVYTVSDIGKPKVDALAGIAQGLNITPHNGLFPIDKDPPKREEGVPLIVVSAVDSFEARKEIATWAHHHGADLFVDTRAHGEMAVHCIVPPSKLEDFIKELPSDEEAPMPACGMEGTSYVGQIVAARVTAGINSWFKGVPVSLIHVEDLGMGQVLRHETVMMEA